MTVREDTHDIGATTDLFVKPFLGLLERIFGQCSTGKAVKARMSSAASRTYKAASQKPAVVSLSTTSPNWAQVASRSACSNIERTKVAIIGQLSFGTLDARLAMKCVLCRPRHKTHYADVRVMPTWTEVPLWEIGSAAMRSA